MVKRFLITTALEETWLDNEPVLFLGEWCRLYSRKDHWLTMDTEVMPYHWDDRAQFYSDYQYLRDFYERLLKDLTVQLNQIHDVDHSLRYWRILIGPWLGYFTQMLFDRWTSIHRAISEYDLTGTVVLSGHDDTLVPNDMDAFTPLFLMDEWNHHIYADILQQFTKVSCIEQIRHGLLDVPNRGASVNRIRKIKQTMAECFSRSAGLLTKNRDAFFLSTYLPFLDEIKLHRRMGQVPQLWRSVSPPLISIDLHQRNWIVIGKNRNEFEKCARAFIPKQIPAVYLEGYSKLVEKTAGLPWPRKPKLIWTSSSYNSDDVFKAWAAKKVENGSPLVIGQHGGGFGTHLWAYYEEHQKSICDAFLSWGWTEKSEPKVKAVGELKAKYPLNINHAEQTGVLLVTGAIPRQSYHIYSVVVSRQWLDYFNDQCTFVENLPPHIRDALTVRLYVHDYGWEQALRWRDRFSDIRLDDGQKNINKLIKRSRIYVSTYNATTFLESFTMNVPTVIYWNPYYWELRDSAKPFFADLKRVGIFHETPESAARHIEKIWEDVDSWWTSPAVQEVLEPFKKRYCYLPDNLLDCVEKTLREIVSTSNRSF